jgi:hypothetical protein
VTESNLAIARKVVLVAGLLVATLLFLFPHWQASITALEALGALGGGSTFDQDIGRGFIAFPPVQLTGKYAKVAAHINYARQVTEVAIALLVTFGLFRALRLKKPAGDTAR